MSDIQKLNTDESSVIKFGFTVLFVVFVFIGGWMAIAPLSNSAVAVGKVSADLEKKVIQHLEGGIVKHIYVQDGSIVKEGDSLIKLDEVQIKAELNIFKTQYEDNLAIIARLEAQRNDDKEVTFPPELTDLNQIKDQNNIFYSAKKSLDDEKKISLKRIQQLEQQILGLESLNASKLKKEQSLKEEINEWNILYEQKLVDKIKIRDLERELNNLSAEIATVITDIAKTKEQIAEIQTQQLLAEKEFKNKILELIVQTKAALSDLKLKITAKESTLNRLIINAPISGKIVGLHLHTEGAVIKPGENILQIVPENSALIVSAQVNVTDIDKVKVGLLSDIRFSAFNTQKVQSIEGEVIHVSADRFLDEVSKQPYYEAKIKVTLKGEEELKKHKLELVAGMPAEVMIKTGTRTMLSYLIKPFANMLSRGFNEE